MDINREMDLSELSRHFCRDLGMFLVNAESSCAELKARTAASVRRSTRPSSYSTSSASASEYYNDLESDGKFLPIIFLSSSPLRFESSISSMILNSILH